MEARNRAVWRAWLRRHHRTASGVWLVYQKKHSATPRKPRSTWSPSNKRRVTRLLAEKRMQPAGLAKIAAAKADGSWESLDTVETLTMPADLRSALAADGDALRNFRGYAAAHTSGREFRP